MRNYTIHHVPGQHINFNNRQLLQSRWNAYIKSNKHPSHRKFAKEVGLPYETWRREYERGKVGISVVYPRDRRMRIYCEYDAMKAQDSLNPNGINKGTKMLVTNILAKRFSTLVLKEKRSPYDATQILRKEFPNKHIPCTRTWYNHIAHGDLDVKYGDTPYHPRMHRKPRIIPHQAKTVPGRLQISERPQGATDRLEFGHFEMDTVVSCLGGKGGLLVLLERKTRLYFIEKLPSISQNDVLDAIERIKRRKNSRLPKVLSVTTDNGCEFLNDAKLSKSFCCNIYYTRAYASYDKGSIENCNRLIRRWYPKGTNFDECSKADISLLEKIINSIHRLALGGLNAVEYANQLRQAVNH